MNGCRYVGEDGLYIALDCVLPLLVRCGALMSTLVVLVELIGFVRAEGCVVIAAEYPWFESSSSEEAEYAAEVVKEGFFVAGFNGVAKQVFAPSVSERNKLSVPFDAFRIYRADVVIADTFADRPLVVLAVIRFACRGEVFGVGEGCWAGCCNGGWLRWWSFRPDQFTVFVTLGEDAYKARLSIEYAAYVCVCNTSVAPSRVYSYAHLVFVEVSGPAMESIDSGGCTARYLV